MMYHEDILEHYKEPQNFGLLENATYVRKEHNPTCGDIFTFSVITDDAGVIQDIGFSGEGCAISTASASLLSEELKGENVNDLSKFDTAFALDMLGIELSPTRLKCALLPFQAATNLTNNQK